MSWRLWVEMTSLCFTDLFRIRLVTYEDDFRRRHQQEMDGQFTDIFRRTLDNLTWMVSVENDTEHTDPLKLKWYESNREKSWQTPKVPEVFDRDWNHPDVSPQMTTEVSPGGHWVNSYEWNLLEYFRETLWGVWWESLWPLTRMWQLDGSFT